MGRKQGLKWGNLPVTLVAAVVATLVPRLVAAQARLDMTEQIYRPGPIGTPGYRTFQPPRTLQRTPAEAEPIVTQDEPDLPLYYILSPPDPMHGAGAAAPGVAVGYKPLDQSRFIPGLTLEKAIELLTVRNLELQAAAEDVKQARADLVTAGLRANPQLVPAVQQVPYGSFNNNTQGGPTLYNVQLSVPLDLSGKRTARVRGAEIAVLAAEASYQDAVRKQIDNLYTAFVDYLAAQVTRDAIGLIEQDLRRRAEVIETKKTEAAESARERAKAEGKAEAEAKKAADAAALEVTRTAVEEGFRRILRPETAAAARREAEAVTQRKLYALAGLLDIQVDPKQPFRVQDTLIDDAPEPPPTEDLIRLALRCRPDLASLRLVVARATADVATVRANRFDDVVVNLVPYTFGNGQPYDQRSGTSWGLSANIPAPLFNRQKGNLAKADSLVRQGQLRLAAAERDVARDVRDASRKYEETASDIRTLGYEVAHAPRYFNDTSSNMLPKGNVARLGDDMNELKSDRFRESLRKYHAAFVEHRKSMLRLNTAVGCVVMPVAIAPPIASPGVSPVPSFRRPGAFQGSRR